MNVPVVFCGINNYTPGMRKQIPHSPGVAEFKELNATLDLIMHLHPHTQKVALICDDTVTC
jgi:hypothetical protein